MIRMSRNKKSAIKNLLLAVSFLSVLTACFDDRTNSGPATITTIPSITTRSPEHRQTNVNIYKPIIVNFNVNIKVADDNVVLLRYQSSDSTNFNVISNKADQVRVSTKVINSKLIITPLVATDSGFVNYTDASRYKLRLVGLTDVINNPIQDAVWEFATALNSVNPAISPEITQFTLDATTASIKPGQSNRFTLIAAFTNGTGTISSDGNPDIVLGTANETVQTFTVAINPSVNTIYTLNVINTSRKKASATAKTVVYNQAGQFAFELLSSNIKETAGIVSLRVIRLGGAKGFVSVQYQTLNSGTATSNSDYVSIPVPASVELPTLVFPDKVTSQVIDIVITNDQSVNELPIEFFSVSLLNPLGGAGINADKSEHKVGIINDDILSVDFGIKQLNFSWTKYPGAIKYNLLEQTNGQGFNVISVIDANSIATLSKSIEISVYLYDWLNSSYMLEACDSNNTCVSSNTVITTNQSLKTIGLLKSSNREIFDSFDRVALSANGQVLVVSAVGEASAIPGIINRITGGVFPTASNDDDSAPLSGAAYVFNRQQNETGAYAWQQTAYIKPSNPESNDLFGYAVALSGDGKTLAVSTRYEASNQAGVVNLVKGKAVFPTIRSDDNSIAGGAVYIFTHHVDGWRQQAYIKSSDIVADDGFGASVALSSDGTTLAVGAPFKPSGANILVGRVYLFKQSNLGWVENTILKPRIIQSIQFYGYTLSLNRTGDVLAVGATENANQTGAVYYYRIDKTQSPVSWNLKSYLKPSNGQVGQNFGRSVVLSNDGDTLAVGASQEMSSYTGVLNKIASPATSTITLPVLGGGAGAVYVFGRNKNLNSNNFLVQNTYIKALNPNRGDFFGEFIALSGDGLVLAVSARSEASALSGVFTTGFPTIATDVNSIPKAGAVYLYTRNKIALGINSQASIWTYKAFIKARSTSQGNFFGGNIALAGKQQANGKVINNGSSLAVGSSSGAYLY